MTMGDPSHRPLNRSEPTPVVGEPAKPVFTDPEAAAEWDTMLSILDQLGLLSVDVGPILARYCRAHAHELAAEKTVAAEGRIITTPHGTIKHPALGIGKEWCLVALRCLCELGIGPSARTGVKCIKRQDAEPDLVQFARSKNEPKATWTNTNPAKSRTGLAWQDKTAKEIEYVFL